MEEHDDADAGPALADTLEQETPQNRMDRWLARFESRLAARDVKGVTELFRVDSFWRDLVSFTWNLRTSEGRDAIGAMLDARLDDTDPSGFATLEPATEDGGVVSAFIEFRTAAGTGKGHLRISRGDDGEDRAWTLLTTLRELTGHEEPQGTRRVMGAVHGQSEDPRSWANVARPRSASSDARSNPTR